MRKNLGGIDRSVRALVAAALGALVVLGAVDGTAAVVAAVAALLLLFTSVSGFCSLYLPFGFDTRKSGGEGRDCGSGG